MRTGDQPQLSVVIPSHRRTDLLSLCLSSVVRFAPVGTEILVVDDGSPGGVVSDTAASYPGVRVVRNVRSGGFCRAANAGIRASSGDIVQMLNDDAEVTVGWTAALDRFADPTVGAVAPLVLQHGTGRVDSAGDEYDSGGFARKRGHGESAARFQSAQPVWGVSAAAGFYRRSVLLEAGLFPDEFVAYFDDVDLSHRIRRLGHTVWYEPRSVVWHRVSASYGRRLSRRLVELQSRNEEWVFWRYAQRRHLLRHAAVLAGKAVRRWQDGTFVPWSIGRCRGWAAATGVSV